MNNDAEEERTEMTDGWDDILGTGCLRKKVKTTCLL